MLLFENFRDMGIMFEDYLPKQYTGSLHHYTSINNWKSILLNEKGDDVISLYATRIDCLNDYMENKFAMEVYQEVVKELCEEDMITEKYRERLEGVQVNSLFPMLKDGVEGYHKCDAYVLCFSMEKDLLNLWKYYSKGNRYEGISIELSNNFVSDIQGIGNPFEIVTYPVVYDEKEQKTYIRKFIMAMLRDEANWKPEIIKGIIEDALLMWNILFKGQGFAEEKEVRSVVFIPKSNSTKIEYRTSNAFIIPYINLKINKRHIKGIRFGPMNKDIVIKNISILKEALSRKFKDFDVESSDLKLRY